MGVWRVQIKNKVKLNETKSVAELEAIVKAMALELEQLRACGAPCPLRCRLRCPVLCLALPVAALPRSNLPRGADRDVMCSRPSADEVRCRRYVPALEAALKEAGGDPKAVAAAAAATAAGAAGGSTPRKARGGGGGNPAVEAQLNAEISKLNEAKTPPLCPLCFRCLRGRNTPSLPCVTLPSLLALRHPFIRCSRSRRRTLRRRTERSALQARPPTRRWPRACVCSSSPPPCASFLLLLLLLLLFFFFSFYFFFFSSSSSFSSSFSYSPPAPLPVAACRCGFAVPSAWGVLFSVFRSRVTQSVVLFCSCNHRGRPSGRWRRWRRRGRRSGRWRSRRWASSRSSTPRSRSGTT